MRKLYLSCAALLLLASFSLAQAPSPPSPEIEQNVNGILSKMTLEQKVDMVGGINIFDVRGYPELGLPLLHTAHRSALRSVRRPCDGRRNLAGFDLGPCPR